MGTLQCYTWHRMVYGVTFVGFVRVASSSSAAMQPWLVYILFCGLTQLDWAGKAWVGHMGQLYQT